MATIRSTEAIGGTHWKIKDLMDENVFHLFPDPARLWYDMVILNNGRRLTPETATRNRVGDEEKLSTIFRETDAQGVDRWRAY